MAEQKIIFCDIDGTLVDHAKDPSPKTVQAVRRARAKGHLLMLCSGRSNAEIFSSIWDLGMDGIVGGNGAYVQFHDELLFSNFLSLDLLQRFGEFMNTRGGGYFLESNVALYANRFFFQRSADVLGVSLAEAEKSLAAVFPKMLIEDHPVYDHITKLCAVMSPEIDADDLKRSFANELSVNYWNFFGNGQNFADISQKGITKGHTITKLLAHFGISRENSYGIGDGNNDFEMLQAVGTGIAMGNAVPRLKEIADYVTATVSEDGLAQAFEHFGLI